MAMTGIEIKVLKIFQDLGIDFTVSPQYYEPLAKAMRMKDIDVDLVSERNDLTQTLIAVHVVIQGTEYKVVSSPTMTDAIQFCRMYGFHIRGDADKTERYNVKGV